MTPLPSEGFTPEAAKAFRAANERFVRDLEYLSRSAAARQSADMVSRSHVLRAAADLSGAPARKWSRVNGVVGGLLLGSAQGHLLSMLSDGAYSGPGVGLTVAFSVVEPPASGNSSCATERVCEKNRAVAVFLDTPERRVH